LPQRKHRHEGNISLGDEHQLINQPPMQLSLQMTLLIIITVVAGIAAQVVGSLTKLPSIFCGCLGLCLG
jgi:hypothetical protein